MQSMATLCVQNLCHCYTHNVMLDKMKNFIMTVTILDKMILHYNIIDYTVKYLRLDNYSFQ